MWIQAPCGPDSLIPECHGFVKISLDLGRRNVSITTDRVTLDSLIPDHHGFVKISLDLGRRNVSVITNQMTLDM